jgi:hypothetical protein
MGPPQLAASIVCQCYVASWHKASVCAVQGCVGVGGKADLPHVQTSQLDPKQTLALGSRERFTHRIAGTRPESTNWRSALYIAVGQVETAGGLSARKVASNTTSLAGSHLKCSQQGATHSPKPRIWRYVIKPNRSCICH